MLYGFDNGIIFPTVSPIIIKAPKAWANNWKDYPYSKSIVLLVFNV